MAVHICQMMCPERHTIFALAYEEDQMTDEEAMARANAVLDTKQFNPWCGLCGSRDLKPECGVTKFATIEEATPHLKKSEQEQLLTRQVFGRY